MYYDLYYVSIYSIYVSYYKYNIQHTWGGDVEFDFLRTFFCYQQQSDELMVEEGKSETKGAKMTIYIQFNSRSVVTVHNMYSLCFKS